MRRGYSRSKKAFKRFCVFQGIPAESSYRLQRVGGMILERAKGVAQTFHEILPTSDLFLLPGARHFVQMDEPKEVARLILSARIAESAEQRR